MVEGEWWRCGKCQSLFKVSVLAVLEEKACPYCQEPSQELHHLAEANWSSSDFFPGKDEKG